MKAIKVQSQGKAAVVSDAPVPQPRDDYLLVKVHAVGLNPTDWKHIGMILITTSRRNRSFPRQNTLKSES